MADDKKKVKKNKAGTVQQDPNTRKSSLTGKDFTNIDYKGKNEANIKAKKAAARYGKSTTSCMFNKAKTRKSCTTYDKNGNRVNVKIYDAKSGNLIKTLIGK
jgi:hypothetical protein